MRVAGEIGKDLLGAAEGRLGVNDPVCFAKEFDAFGESARFGKRCEFADTKGDDLKRLKGLVDFELFRSALETAVPRGDRSKGGWPPFDHVLMFKALILQAMRSLSDERCEYLIKDRLSFMRFLGLGFADAVPDANTIWSFREALKKADAVDALFARFDATLRETGFLAVRSSMRRSSPRPSSATRSRKRKRLKRAAFPTRGRTSRPKSHRRIATRAGR